MELLKKLKELVALQTEMINELARLINTYQDPSKDYTSVGAAFEFTETPGSYIQPSLPTADEVTRRLDAISLAGKVDNSNSKEDCH